MPDAPDPSVATLIKAKPKPYWLPDTQGFLAIAIIILMGTIVLILLNTETKFDDKTAGVLMTVLGVLTACLKDVYSYFFGSSKGEEKKGDVISTIATAPTPPVVPPTLDQLAAAQLTAAELTHFNTLATDDLKKQFMAMTPEQRIAAIGKT